MMAEMTSKARIGLIGGVVRGPPPASCADTCLDRGTEMCGTCGMRPIKQVDISYGSEPTLDEAIRKGLTTPEEIEKFRRQITGAK